MRRRCSHYAKHIQRMYIKYLAHDSRGYASHAHRHQADSSVSTGRNKYSRKGRILRCINSPSGMPTQWRCRQVFWIGQHLKTLSQDLLLHRQYKVLKHLNQLDFNENKNKTRTEAWATKLVTETSVPACASTNASNQAPVTSFSI